MESYKLLSFLTLNQRRNLSRTHHNPIRQFPLHAPPDRSNPRIVSAIVPVPFQSDKHGDLQDVLVFLQLPPTLLGRRSTWDLGAHHLHHNRGPVAAFIPHFARLRYFAAIAAGGAVCFGPTEQFARPIAGVVVVGAAECFVPDVDVSANFELRTQDCDSVAVETWGLGWRG